MRKTQIFLSSSHDDCGQFDEMWVLGGGGKCGERQLGRQVEEAKVKKKSFFTLMMTMKKSQPRIYFSCICINYYYVLGLIHGQNEICVEQTQHNSYECNMAGSCIKYMTKLQSYCTNEGNKEKWETFHVVILIPFDTNYIPFIQTFGCFFWLL